MLNNKHLSWSDIGLEILLLTRSSSFLKTVALVLVAELKKCAQEHPVFAVLSLRINRTEHLCFWDRKWTKLAEERHICTFPAHWNKQSGSTFRLNMTLGLKHISYSGFKILFIPKSQLSSTSLVNVMCSITTPVINTGIIPKLLEPCGKSAPSWPQKLNKRFSRVRVRVSLICRLKGIQSNYKVEIFSSLYDSEPLNIYHEWKCLKPWPKVWNPLHSWHSTKRKAIPKFSFKG